MNRPIPIERQVVLATGIDSSIEGEIWECGVFRGENALWIKQFIGTGNRVLRLFDTFSGMPFSGPRDHHKIGSMNDTSAEYVSGLFSGHQNVIIHPGIMPNTFSGLENAVIAVVNIDVDNYDSVKACLEFVYPRVASGGYIVLDDYGCCSCPGAKLATDEFLLDKKEKLSDNRCGPQVHFIKQ